MRQKWHKGGLVQEGHFLHSHYHGGFFGGHHHHGFFHHHHYGHGYHYHMHGACFPHTARVVSESQGDVSIASLSVGERVRTQHGWGEVLFFAVHKPDARSTFVKISTPQHTLLVSRSHAILLTDGSAVLAGRVHVGMQLMSGTVQRVDKQHGVGLYAPVTSTGALLVDGIATSDYGPLAQWAGQRTAHSLLAPLRVLKWAFPSWHIWHAHARSDGTHPLMAWGQWLFQL